MLLLSRFFSNPDLRSRIFIALSLIFIFRLGSHIPLSFVDLARVGGMFDSGTTLGFLNMVSGGGLSRLSVFSLGILPFINASIIMQLLVLSFPYLKSIQDEGESGRRQISQYTRYLSVFLSIIQSIVLVFGLGVLVSKSSTHSFDYIVAIFSLVAGSSLVMWLGEILTERGFGNGSSILIFCGILSAIPADFRSIALMIASGTSFLNVFLLIFLLALLLIIIVYSQEAIRRIPTFFVRGVSGARSAVTKSSSFIPFKLVNSGIMPIIFASAALQIPTLFAQVFPKLATILASVLDPDSFIHAILLIFLIFFFSYFYNAVTFNPNELASNLNKQSCVVEGIRPGTDTVLFLDRVLSNLTLLGALILSFVSVMPSFAKFVTGVATVSLGGTSLLILVGVALEIVRHCRTLLLANAY